MIDTFYRLIRGLTAKSLSYFTTASTGTGSEQSLTHGLGRIPDLVLVIPYAGNNGSGASGTQTATILEGTHTSTAVKVTVTSGSTFKVLAF